MEHPTLPKPLSPHRAAGINKQHTQVPVYGHLEAWICGLLFISLWLFMRIGSETLIRINLEYIFTKVALSHIWRPFSFCKTRFMINLKPLIWESGESIISTFPNPVLVSINDLVEFAILIHSGDPDREDVNFKLEIVFGSGHWDCFYCKTIEQCQDRASIWWKEKIKGAFDPEDSMRIPLGDGFFAIVDVFDYDVLANFRWYRSASGYAYRSESGVNISMHRQVMSPEVDMHIDHINGDRLDNRKSNLRICTAAQNCMNYSKPKNNTSGFKGVHWHKRDKRWIARIKVNGKKVHLGSFLCKIEAAKAYNEASIKFHGEFGRLNEIL